MFDDIELLEEFSIINDEENFIQPKKYKIALIKGINESDDSEENETRIYLNCKSSEDKIRVKLKKEYNNNVTISFIKSNLSTDLTNINSMFNGCKGLKTLNNLSNLNISKVIDMSYMFKKCSSLKSLSDISD